MRTVGELTAKVLEPDETLVETHSRRPGAVALARERRAKALFHYLIGPLAGALTVASLMGPTLLTDDAPFAAFLAFSGSALLARRSTPWLRLLPLMRSVWRGAGPALGVGALAVLKLVAILPGRASTLVAGSLATVAVSNLPALLFYRRREAVPQIRIAVIGSPVATAILVDELRLAAVKGYVVVGNIAVQERAKSSTRGASPRMLGSLGQLRQIVVAHRIDLLVMGADIPRLAVFHEVAQSCMDQPIRLWQLSGLYEDLFGHVPIGEINAAWFQYVLHPHYRQASPIPKRLLDVTVAATLLVVTLPLLAILATGIRRRGRPFLYRQQRIGQGGEPFTLYKIRTMEASEEDSAQWTASDDPRITGIGRALRRSHLDELPQLFNVLRGEMSLVGPRPEQPEFVERLETVLEFYQRRHLLRPGITGWAQVRCGYLGSEIGSAWKLCHDLYYLKHRSLAMDLMILGETLRTLFVQAPPAIEPPSDRFEPTAVALRTGV